MWMQNSVGGGASGNFHDRNRFGSQYAQGGSYGGGGGGALDAGDWKSKILESGQWLGGKVIEYGGKLARGPNSDAIPDQYATQMPRNDGRANWMADIRTSSSSYSGGGGAGGYNGSGGGYQNDFATERPKAYSDYHGSSYSSNPKPYGGYEPKSLASSDHHHSHHHHHGKSRHAKKKSEGKKGKKSGKKSKKKHQSDSESESERESESEELSISESSETESADERRYKSKVKAKKKSKSKNKKHGGFYSEESESDEDDGKKRASADYSFSFDPAKLPPPPVEKETSSKKSKSKKSKKEKSGKKARTRRQSMASTDDETASEKETSRKAKKRGGKKAAAASSASVDLLGVDLDVQPAATPATAGLPAQEVQPSVFDAPLNQNPLQDLAGLSFTAPVRAPAPAQPSVFDGNVPAAASNEAEAHSQQQADAFRTNLLPENNIVDFNSLASEKKRTLSANPEEKRTLNDMQKARGVDQPTPVMAMPMQGQPQMQQNMPGGMMQLNMNQLQITDGSTGMQQPMYSNMQMQGMSQPQMQSQMMMMQPQMGMMSQPQMMNMQMMQQQQQQFAQGGVPMAQPAGAQQQQQPPQGMMSGAANPNSSDPFHQLP